jgi:hypothetical protein
MSHSANLRRRAGLLASSSLIAASATVAFGMGMVVLTPTTALAADECGVPGANAGAADVFVCAAGTYPTGIVYPTTDGDLTLTLEEDATGAVVTTNGGIQVTGAAGDALVLDRAVTAGNGGLGDPSIVNTAGAGITYTSPDSDITINLSDVDTGDTALTVTGSTSGVTATTAGAGNIAITLTNGTVTGEAGVGIGANAAAGSATVSTGAATINSTNTAAGAVAAGVAAYANGGIAVSGSGTINATGDLQAFGVLAVGDGAIVVNQTGTINSTADYAWGVYTLGTAGSSIAITTGTVNVTQTGGAFGGGKGISAYTGGAVTINAGSTNTTGLYADGIFVGGVFGIAGDTTIVSGAVTTTGDEADGIDVGAHGVIDITSTSITTSGLNSNGIEADSDLANVVIRSSNISATGAGSIGIAANGATGVAITTGSVTAGATGIVAGSTGGNVLITGAGGTITGNAGNGITAVSDTGSTTVNLGATNVVSLNTGVGANSYGVSVTGATGVTVTGTGTVTATAGNYAIGVYASSPGAIVVNQTGTINAAAPTGYAWGVYAINTGGNSIAITTGAVNVTQGGGLLGGGDGISAYTTGAVTIASGAISTTGDFADGIFVGGVGGIAGNTVINAGAITTTGADSDGIDVGAHGSIAITTAAINVSGAGSNAVEAISDLSTVAVTTNGAIVASGAGSNGLWVRGETGLTITTNANVTANTNAINSLVTGVGNATINVGAASVVRAPGTGAGNVAVQVETQSGSTTTINNTGTIRSMNATVAGAAADLAIQGAVGNVVINNTGRIDGRLNFADLTGTNRAQINVTGAGNWHTTGVTTLSGGNDAIVNSGLISTLGTTTIDFGADTGLAPRDVFTNSGRLVAGETSGAALLTLSGLETFNNSGTIFFGSLDGGLTSDGQTNDRIVMTGTNFVGSGASVLAMDVNLGVTGQASCAAAVVADCLSLPGGTVSGVTGIRINNTNGGPGGLNTAGITLVEAGSITAGSLVIDPSSANYVTRGGAGAVDNGFFFYRLVPQGTTRVALVSAPDAEAFEFVQLGGAASDVWHLTTGTWHDRQADLRDGFAGEGDRAGVWLKIFGAQTERDEEASFDSLGTIFTFDTSFEQNTAGLVGGIDLIGGASDNGGWLGGVSVGYVDSDVTFNETNTLYSLSGLTGGVYGSFVSGGWYVDGNISGNWLDVDYSTPNSTPGVTFTEAGSIDSLGAQVETGWRFPLGSTAWVEPMGSVSWVSTSFDDVTVPGGSVEIDDVDSLRASLGVRVGMTTQFSGFKLQPSLYAKAWNEFEGDASTTFNNTGAAFGVEDDFSGSFADVGGQLNVFSEGGLTAFVNGGYKWNSDFNTTKVTIGFRYQF